MAESARIEVVRRALPPEKQAVLQEASTKLSEVPGVAALVLGGSYAIGAQRPDSDVDLGLYYAENSPFSIDSIRRIAHELSGTRKATVTGFYEWGAWVNGGAWIQTAAGKMDLLYRNVDQVRNNINEARNGATHLDFLQQPPFGFHSVIYLAETSICIPLFDPMGVVAGLKALVDPYPALLKQSIVKNWLWGVEFTLLHARDFALRADVYNTVGCLTRALSYLTQVLFALNETYFISDKKALETIASFSLKPPDYAFRVSRLLGHAGTTPEELSATVHALGTLFGSVAALADGLYQPKYSL